jgi:predicted RNase H-like HicB family nuclease
MPTYLAVIHKDEDSEYGVSFPDFPGCVAAGATMAAALDSAREALLFHLDGMVEDGEQVPRGLLRPPCVTSVRIDLPLPNPETELRKERERLEKTARAAGIAPWFMNTLSCHIIHGARPAPHGLSQAMLENDLCELAEQAFDPVNAFSIVRWLHEEAPVGCWGSRERVEAWQAHNGLRGQKEKS